MSLKKGGVISFRLPNDITEEILDYLNNLKRNSGRTYSSRILQIFLKGLANEMQLDVEDYMFLKIPRELNIKKRKWLQSKETQEYLLSILMQSLPIQKEPKENADDGTMINSNNIPTGTEAFIFNNFFDLDD